MVTDARQGRDEIACAWHNFASSLYIGSKCWPRVSLRHEALPEERLPAHADPKLGLDTHPAYWKRKRLHVLLYCTTILLHTLFTLVLYLSMYTRTHPKHTRGTNPFSAISPCITFLVIVDSSSSSSSVLSRIHYCTIRQVSKPPM